jgi:putative exosortase-associated protein (TIGR04073 family)
MPLSSAAGEGTAGDYFRDIGTKLGRGLLNILLSPGEIGCSIASETADKKALGVATGLGKGLAFMLRRMFVGVNETITFIIPMEPTLPPPCWAD